MGGGLSATSGGGSGGGGTSGGASGGGASGGVSAGGASGGSTSAGGASGPGCAGKTWALCEDFEGAAAGALPAGWTQLNGWGQGTVNVSTMAAHGGTKALLSVTTNAGQPRAQHPLPAALGGHHWGRAFYRVEPPAPNAATTSNYFHITFVGLRAGSNESRVVDTVQSPSARVQYLYNLPDDSCCDGSGYTYRYDGQWHCAEWYVDNASDSFRFFIDDTEVTAMGFTGRTGARLADFTTLAVGSIHYVPSNGTLRVWIDDVAVDGAARIGCQ